MPYRPVHPATSPTPPKPPSNTLLPPLSPKNATQPLIAPHYTPFRICVNRSCRVGQGRAHRWIVGPSRAPATHSALKDQGPPVRPLGRCTKQTIPTSSDVRQESVAQALALRRAAHQTGNVHHIEESGHRALRLVQRAEPVEAVIRDVNTRSVGVDGAEREVCGRWSSARELGTTRRQVVQADRTSF